MKHNIHNNNQLNIKHTLFSFITITPKQETVVFDTQPIQALFVALFVMCKKQTYTHLTFLVKKHQFRYLLFSIQTQKFTNTHVTILLDPCVCLSVKVVITSAFRSSLALTAFYVAKKNTTLLLHTEQIHTVSDSESSVLVQGIADYGTKVVHNGSITITKSAKQAVTKQTSKHITLSPTAFVYAKPVLNVMQNSVQCSHGSAIDIIQDSMLFYLQSRGYTKKDATYCLLVSMTRHNTTTHNMLHKALKTMIRENKELDERF